MGEKIRVLITVKTYPLPSEKYKELVCTAGVLEDGSFIRLYPIDYRYRPYWQWYKKYQRIEVEVEKNLDDPRPESYRPVEGAAIRTLGKLLSTKDNWRERKSIVLAGGVNTMCELEAYKQDQRSLGIIKPREVLDFIIEKDTEEWKPKWRNLFDQQMLFGNQQKPLEKIPYKFSYRFKCENPKCKTHTKMIEDWEVGALFLRMRDKYGPEAAVEKVRDMFYLKICAAERDTHFFVGTVLHYGSWVILGTFWPKKVDPELPF